MGRNNIIGQAALLDRALMQVVSHIGRLWIIITRLTDRADRFTAWQAEVSDLNWDRTQPPLWASDHAAVVATFAPRDSRH